MEAPCPAAAAAATKGPPRPACGAASPGARAPPPTKPAPHRRRGRPAANPGGHHRNYKYVVAFRQRKQDHVAALQLQLEARRGEVLALTRENRVLRAHEKLLTLTLGEHGAAAGPEPPTRAPASLAGRLPTPPQMAPSLTPSPQPRAASQRLQLAPSLSPMPSSSLSLSSAPSSSLSLSPAPSSPLSLAPSPPPPPALSLPLPAPLAPALSLPPPSAPPPSPSTAPPQDTDAAPSSHWRAVAAYCRLVAGAHAIGAPGGRRLPRAEPPSQAGPHLEALALLQRLTPIEHERLAATNLETGQVVERLPEGHWQRVAAGWLPSHEEAALLATAMGSFQAAMDREAAQRREHHARLGSALARASDPRQLAAAWVGAGLGGDDAEALLAALSAQLEREARTGQVVGGILALLASERSAQEVALLSWPYLANWVQVCAAKFGGGCGGGGDSAPPAHAAP